MMTREEYIEQYPNPNQIGFEDAYEILEENAEKYINLLEQRIAELEQRVKALIDERANMQKTHRDTISTFVSEHTIMGVMLNNSILNCYLCDDCLKDAK